MSPIESSAQPWEAIPASGPLIRPQDAANYLGCSLSQYYTMAAAGLLPKPLKIVPQGRASGVPRPWLDAVIAARAAEGAV